MENKHKELEPNINWDCSIDLIRHEDKRTGAVKGFYWLMDDYLCGWLVSKTYSTKSEAVIKMAKNELVWEEQDLKVKENSDGKGR